MFRKHKKLLIIIIIYVLIECVYYCVLVLHVASAVGLGRSHTFTFRPRHITRTVRWNRLTMSRVTSFCGFHVAYVIAAWLTQVYSNICSVTRPIHIIKVENRFTTWRNKYTIISISWNFFSILLVLEITNSDVVRWPGVLVGVVASLYTILKCCHRDDNSLLLLGF